MLVARVSPRRAALIVFLAALVATTLLLAPTPAPRAATVQRTTAHAMHGMSDAAMRAARDQWFATHPARGERSAATASDTFLAINTRFDTDGSALTQVDTAHIEAGQTILWRLSGIGTHTATSGNGISDPEAGLLFNVPIDAVHPEFSFTFATAGVYHFFCQPHELFNMRGVVIVSPTSAGVGDGVAPLVGFVSNPSPNPTGAGATFRFALRSEGRVRAEMIDLEGRSVAIVVDREFGPGTWTAAWDGRGRDGRRASPGRYWLRLAVPGTTQTRSVVVAR